MTTNAKDEVLAAAERDGWHLRDDYISSAELSHPTGIDLVVEFTRWGRRVSRAISYDPYFKLTPADRVKRARLLAFLADPDNSSA